MFKMPNGNDSYIQKKIKRKFGRTEAEKACAKEAAASRLALEALQREIASAPQVGSFVIEESCTETTVENFIPHTDEPYIEHLDHGNVPQLQVVNFHELNNSFVNNQIIDIEKTEAVGSIMQFDIPTSSSTDKLPHILGTEIPANLEIMFRTSGGQYVNLTEEELQNLSGETLQYQFVDENGQLSEVRQLQVPDQRPLPTYNEAPTDQSFTTFPELDEKISEQANRSPERKEDDSNRFLDSLRHNNSPQNLEKVKLTDVDLTDIVDITDIIDESGLNGFNKGELIDLSSPTSNRNLPKTLTQSPRGQDVSLMGGGDCYAVDDENCSTAKMNETRRRMSNRKKRIQ
ncbi:hypothetical protein RI129_000342 [Pyrocoelia pectoralis]|uniref:Uncharacterized protein n=1 Tax=Pyrocoelia pectoralis TaxID=417401 RepID=A0AAN7ZVW3_9COLE